jgi:glycosyltransferase involved in cell wall biosynthesis
VVAAYDAGATLGYAIESLLDQTHTALEILIGDDESRDETREVMQRYARDPRVRLFRSRGNQGAYNVRAQLAAHARGEFISFHDADDWAFPSRIAAQVAALSRSGTRAVVGGLLRVTPEGNVQFFKNQRAVRLSRVSLMLRRETFLALGGFRSALVGADHEFAAKLRATYGERAIVRLKAPLMLSRFAPGSAIASRGTESAPDGYRSPVRRAYAQLAFDRYVRGHNVTDQEMDERLREVGNWRAPTGLEPL